MYYFFSTLRFLNVFFSFIISIFWILNQDNAFFVLYVFYLAISKNYF